MEIKPLKLDDIEVKLPIIQGGMGIGVSREKLAAAVSNAGGIGVLSGAQIGYDEEDFYKNPFKANVRALKKHITEAKKNIKNGILGINFMVAQRYYDEYVKEAVDSGIDIIISGAGLPIKLPKLVEGTKVKIAPIVSSARALKLILKSWDKKYKTTADMVVVEGPKAGGHLGFSVEDIEKDIDFDGILLEVMNEVKAYEEKYHKHIPIIAAGGISNGYDIAKYLKLGVDGVQIATRFVTTQECDAHMNYKQKYIEAKKEDVTLVKSPVGLPGRALNNNFVKRLNNQERIVDDKCHLCISSCNPKEIPFCISKVLIDAVKGNADEGLMFCGEKAYLAKEITTVQEVMDELVEQIKEV
ncbi:NAD(P)H-dependent flavin oxidoreductase YrpB (nitropropane dioxygenase family) [Natranaerovirga hydrolytica]|uniref:Probable nitronate monooxygenase n=1 Tax=Natranaerovirga hydrolytica TaxID=680378 RepID=A0A4R1MEH6_9FIRM|nr:nitronate monooxygenase family protein [Natranaerovirga hydrolytica]TCK90527.1 NAD(P)H-dependent flavin oxidoreductase YrpB (nitropropane dioxygenase family) [Natranaerovirga hydrolytica]